MKWIFFDLDDTLYDFSEASLVSLRRLWEEEKIINNIFPTAEAFIDEYHIHNSRMWQMHERGEITADFLKPERFRLTISPKESDSATIAEMQRINDRYLYLLGICNMPCPGAKELLERLKDRFLIGVLTNGFSEVQYNKLRSTGLDRYIQRMVISDEIGIQKPDTRLFRYAEQATGASPEEILMIGDNPVSDITGALNAGWQTVFFDRKGKGGVFDSPLYLGRIESLKDAELLLKRHL